MKLLMTRYGAIKDNVNSSKSITSTELKKKEVKKYTKNKRRKLVLFYYEFKTELVL